MSNSFAIFDTAIGTCGIVWNAHGVVGVQIHDGTEAATRSRLLRRFAGAQEAKPPAHVQGVRLASGGEMPDPAPVNPSDMTVHLLWLNAGLSCDGDSVSLTAATLPSVEDIVMGNIPGLPKVQVHWPLVDFEVGDDFMKWFWKADAG